MYISNISLQKKFQWMIIKLNNELVGKMYNMQVLFRFLFLLKKSKLGFMEHTSFRYILVEHSTYVFLLLTILRAIESLYYTILSKAQLLCLSRFNSLLWEYLWLWLEMGTKYILIICKRQIYDHEPDIRMFLKRRR